VTRFRFVKDHQADYPIKRLCAVVEVSRSGYYAWKARPPAPRVLTDEQLTLEIGEIYTDSRRTYGAPRVHGQLCRRGRHVGCKRVARLMRAQGWVGAHAPQKKRRRRRSDVHGLRDLVRRDFTAPRPNLRWVADITEFPTGEGPLFVAGIRDLCHKGIVGWSMADRQDAELVIDALVMALGRCEPDPEGCVHHSDKGTQYTSTDFTAMATLAGLQVSFGSTGDCFDNAAIESTWSLLKREIAWIRGTIFFDTRDDAKVYLFEFIEVFYNRQRHQEALDHMTPVEYAATFTPAGGSRGSTPVHCLPSSDGHPDETSPFPTDLDPQTLPPSVPRSSHDDGLPVRCLDPEAAGNNGRRRCAVNP
jgi:putative transposase